MSELLTDIQTTLNRARVAEYRGNNVTGWTDTTSAVADHFIGCVPPIYGPGGKVACGEPSHLNTEADHLYLTFRRINRDTGEAECRYLTIAEIKSKIAGVPVEQIYGAVTA